jgi:hypothetical protein
VEEVKSHPWLRGTDWGRLHEATAPYFTPALAAVSSAMERLRGLPASSPEVPALLKTLTQNFDDFSALPPDDPRHATPGGGAGDGGGGAGGGGLAGGLAATTRGSRKARSKFVGYTFKRAPDGRGTYLPGVPGSSFTGSGSAGSGGGSGAVSVPTPPGSEGATAATTMAAASSGQAEPLPLPLPPQPPTTTPR